MGIYKTGMLVGVGLLIGQSLFANGSFVPEAQGTLKVGDFGAIIARSTDTIKDAIVEKVVIYPQHCEHTKTCIERKGMLVRYPEAVATILLCHGFMCDKFDTGFLRRLFPRGRYNLMSFDFRAHGEKKDNQFCTLGRDEAYDVIAAGQFLKNHPDLQGKPLLVYGFSMGAVASIEAQAKEPSLFQAMVLDCPFYSTEDIIKRGIEKLKISLFGYNIDLPGRTILQRYAFHPYVQSLLKMVLKAVAHMDSKDIATRVFPISPSQTVAHVKVPILLIYCKNDEKLTIDAMREIFNNAGSDWKKIWITNGRTHFDSFFYNPERYTEMVRSFVEQAIKGELEEKHKEVIEDGQDQILGW